MALARERGQCPHGAYCGTADRNRLFGAVTHVVTDCAIPVKSRSCSHFIEQYPTEKFLNAGKEIDDATTAEVADLVGC